MLRKEVVNNVTGPMHSDAYMHCIQRAMSPPLLKPKLPIIRRALLDGLKEEVASAKAALQEAEDEEAQARQRAEEALAQLDKLRAEQEKLRTQDDDNEQMIQVWPVVIWN
jgi:hypothetical protein